MSRYPLILIIILMTCCGCQASGIKEAAVADAFYPRDPELLKKSVDRYLAAVRPAMNEPRPLTLIVPHAGHIFSGAIAAEGYARLKGWQVSTVIMIGPSHHAPLNGAAILPAEGMRTPLGTVAVNSRLALSLVNDKAQIRMDAVPFAKEHSLEVQLPFIQRTLGSRVKVVPILLGEPTRESYAALTAGIGRIMRNDPNVLLLISSDLSHYHDQATAKELDGRVVDAVERLSTNDLEQLLASGKGEMCGGWPVIYGITAARVAGATHAVRYRTGTSGDVNKDMNKVVGYAAIGIIKESLSDLQKRRLLELARTTVTRQVTGEKLPDAVTDDAMFRADGATFVTVNGPDGHLRGCIGTISPRMSLYSSVIHNAVSAACRDPRFPPVRREELQGIRVEVTVISPLEPVTDTGSVLIGRHGLYLEKNGHSSVFLPQVPVEQNWDLATYLSQLALKAGLPPDGWKGARLSSFTAEVIR